jgi:hypothetical protein
VVAATAGVAVVEMEKCFTGKRERERERERERWSSHHVRLLSVGL